MGYEAVGWVFTILAGLLMLFLPRKWAAAPLLGMSLSMPPSLEFVVYGLHFPTTRVLIWFGWLRLIVGSKDSGLKLTPIDKTMALWVATEVVAYTLLWQTGGALLNRLGFAIDTLGLYFFVRAFTRDLNDLKRIVKILAVISILVAVSMIVENVTAHNPFAALGGVPLITQVRLGRLRCQGPFLHPITAGIFGAALFPLVFFLLYTGKDRMLGFFSLVATSIIVATSASSGPVAAYVAGIFGLGIWSLRRQMRAIRWGLVLTLLALQVVMKAPVWALIGRAGIVPGSDAYHRQVLIEMFITHFNEWWLLGTKSTSDWAAWFMEPQDITNQYLRIAADAGLFALIFFVAMIVLCFRRVGRTRRMFESRQPLVARLAWAMGVSLFVNVVAFMGCSYWDQVRVVFYTLLALISTLKFLRVTAPSTTKTPASGWLRQESQSALAASRLAFGR